ncbi:MAG: TIGR03936 family radical SAM-associated protein [Clostridia bacterium]|nr:TIGR03936 family radical SAM-associated protein [Clostridia bacterium]
MRNVRVFFTKHGRMKFASHLDMNRLMTRIIRRSGVPIWYTEGFNQHPYITFALPLSLGFTSDYEIMDIRVIDDEFTNEQVKAALEKVFPDGLVVTAVENMVLKTGEVAFAEFAITFKEGEKDFAERLNAFLSQESILTEKKTKKGKMKEIDMAPCIKRFSISKRFSAEEGESVVLNLVLSAGGENNLNPTLLLAAFGETPYYTVCRKMIYDSAMECFK